MVNGSTLDYLRLENKINIYFGLINEGYGDDYNHYKNIEIVERIQLPFACDYSWQIVKVKVERVGMKFNQYLLFRDWCGDTYGYDFVVTPEDLSNISFGQIKFKFRSESDDTCGYILKTNEVLKYNMTRFELLEETYKILNYIKGLE